VARFTEISLGIICAALVSRLILVRELSPKLVQLVRTLTRRADSFVKVLLDPYADAKRVAAERSALANAYLDVQAMQRSAYFESAEARVLDQPLRRLAQAAVELCAMAEAAASHRVGSLPQPEENSVLGEISLTTKPSTGDDEVIVARVRAADERDIELARTRLLACMAAFDRGEDLPQPKTACGLWSDPVAAVLTGLRSALAVGITSAIWFATAWPNGPAAVVVAAVVCSLLASLEQPDKISMAAAATVLIAAVPVFATQFYLMPLAVDFLSMAVALAPLILTCGFIMAQPQIGPLGLLSAVYFAFASNIDNVMTYDALAFLNSSLAILVGIAVAVVLFATFFPETPAFAVRRFRRQLVVHLGYLVNASRCATALSCYRSALCEQLGATLARVKDEPEIAHECFTSARAALSAAQAVGHLRSSIDARMMPRTVAAQGSRLLVRLSQALRNPSVGKLSKRAGEARALARHALATARGAAEPEEIEALSGVVVGSATLGFELMRARIILQEKSNASRI